MQIKKIRSKTKAYGSIIQVNVPVRFYWNKDNTFDGIELGPFDGSLTQHQSRLVNQVLQTIGRLMEHEREPVPDVFTDAFGRD